MGKCKSATDLLNHENYDPEPLIEFIKKKYKMKFDREVASVLGVHFTVMSRVRSKDKLFSAAMAVSVHESTGMSFNDIRMLIGVPDAVF